MKQIAGRAGRYQSRYESGQVTTLHEKDMNYLRQCMKSKDKPIKRAGLYPSLEIMEIFAAIENLGLDDNIMSLFWERKLSKEWDLSEGSSPSNANVAFTGYYRTKGSNIGTVNPSPAFLISLSISSSS